MTPGCPSRSEPIHEPNRSSDGAATGRVPVRPASTASAGGASSAARPPPAATRIERPVERPDVAGDDGEQRLVEDRERRSHLVERRRHHGPQVAGVPQQRDLLAQASPQVRVLVGRRQRVVERVQQPPDPAQRDEQRAAPGLRRVGGEDRVDLDRAEPRLEPGPVGDGGQPLHGLAEGLVDRPALGAPGARPQHADALALLREVDELEVEGERAGDGRRALDVQRPDLRPESLALDVRLEDHLRVAAPQRDRPPPDALDRREQLGPGLLRDDLPQQRAEEPHLVRQGVPRATQPGPRRLGRGGRKPGPPRAGRGPSRSGSAVGHGDRMEEARFGCQSATVTVRLQGHRPGTGPQPISVSVTPRLVR